MDYFTLWAKRFEWKDGGILVALRVVVLWLFFISTAWYVSFHGVPALSDLLDIAGGKVDASRCVASLTGYLLLLLLALERIAKLSDPIRLETKKRKLLSTIPMDGRKLAEAEQSRK